jgi:hypothetical protein
LLKPPGPTVSSPGIPNLPWGSLVKSPAFQAARSNLVDTEIGSCNRFLQVRCGDDPHIQLRKRSQDRFGNPPYQVQTLLIPSMK